eukprot:COSAG01_NODE_40830_length_459_cov_0.855556_1_plen_40_part_10
MGRSLPRVRAYTALPVFQERAASCAEVPQGGGAVCAGCPR